MEVVVDIPESIVELVLGTVGTGDDETSLVGQLDPAMLISLLLPDPRRYETLVRQVVGMVDIDDWCLVSKGICALAAAAARRTMMMVRILILMVQL